MLTNRMHRVKAIERNSSIQNKAKNLIAYHKNKVDLNTNILEQFADDTDSYIITHFISLAGEHRSKKYQALKNNDIEKLTDDELIFLIHGTREDLFEDEREFLEKYENKIRKIFETYTDNELIAEITP